VFTARYALSPYIKQIRFVFKGLRDSRPFSLSLEIKKQLNNLTSQPQHTFIKMFKDDVTSVKFEVPSLGTFGA
jgi:hypothetical protein